MFRALDVRGDIFDTGEYNGKSSLVLFFYRGHWCATCREELLDLKGEYRNIKERDAETVAISTDSLDEAKSMSVELQLPYKVISDPGHHVIDLYDVYDAENGTAFITVFIVDSGGIVRYRRSIAGLEDVLPASMIADKLRDLEASV